MLSPSQKLYIRQRALKQAQGYIGQTEDAQHTNRGAFVVQCLADVGIQEPAPWCAAFVIRCYIEACKSYGFPLSVTNLAASGSCEALISHARTQGAAIDAHLIGKTAHVVPGDLMVQWHAELGRYAHTGIVLIAPLTNSGSFTTIEGNSAPAGSNVREGYIVCLQHRNSGDLADDGHARYGFITSV